MSPKKKAKAAPAEEQTGPIIQAADQCEVDTVNMDHYNALEKAIQTILQHELFENIMNEAPLGIKAGVESHLAGHKARAPGRASNLLLVSIFLFYTPCILPEVCSSFRARLL